MYVVKLNKAPKRNDFRSDYFPRQFRYLRDAKELITEVKQKGGEAFVQRVTSVPALCTYPNCKCIVSTSTTNPEPSCPRL